MEKEILEYLKYGAYILFGSGVVFEITPIKIKPISAILGWIGNKLNRDVKNDIKQLQKDVTFVKGDLQDHKVQSWRRDILDFSDSLYKGECKTTEGFNFIIRTHDSYKKYLEDNDLDNGQINLAFEYILSVYRKKRDDGDFDK